MTVNDGVTGDHCQKLEIILLVTDYTKDVYSETNGAHRDLEKMNITSLARLQFREHHSSADHLRRCLWSRVYIGVEPSDLMFDTGIR